MNNSVLAQTAYANAKMPVMTERGAEYRIFAQITHRLLKANSNDLRKFPELVAAIHDNRRLWNVLAVDVSNPENSLPKKLRAQIFFLAEFTENYSKKVLDRKQDASALIDINKVVMRGLLSSSKGQEI